MPPSNRSSSTLSKSIEMGQPTAALFAPIGPSTAARSEVRTPPPRSGEQWTSPSCEFPSERTARQLCPSDTQLLTESDVAHEPSAPVDLKQWSFTHESEYRGEPHPDGKRERGTMKQENGLIMTTLQGLPLPTLQLSVYRPPYSTPKNDLSKDTHTIASTSLRTNPSTIPSAQYRSFRCTIAYQMLHILPIRRTLKQSYCSGRCQSTWSSITSYVSGRWNDGGR